MRSIVVYTHWFFEASNKSQDLSFVFTFSEERQARNLKQLFGDFVYGNFPGNRQWRPYTLIDRYYYEVDGAVEGR